MYIYMCIYTYAGDVRNVYRDTSYIALLNLFLDTYIWIYGIYHACT